MIVKVPPQIKVGAHRFLLSKNPHLYCDEKLVGSTNFRTQAIEIDSTTPYTEQVVSLVHEIMHCISHGTKCDIVEGDVERLANGLADVFLNEFGIEFDWNSISEHQH